MSSSFIQDEGRRPYRQIRNSLSACALALALGLASSGVHAQSQTEAPEGEASASAPAEEIDQIVVTAKRRTDDLQTTGVSATVLTGADLIDKSVDGLIALQYAAPSVTISDYGSANVFNIRGIGRSQVDVDLPSGVVIYRDGAPTLAGYFQNEPYFDMRAIEVLRGPQGTFSGKSAAGGAVFITTRSPELGEFGGMAEAGLGDFDQREFTGVVNMPVGEDFAVRFAYNHFERDDYYDDIRGDFRGDPGIRDHDSFRLGLRWAPTENLDVVLKTDVSHLDFGGNVTSSFGDDLFNVVQNANFRYTDDSVRVVLDVKYELGNGITLSSLSGYQDVDTVNNLDLNATEDPFYVFNSAGDIEIYSQEFNLISPEDQRLRWVLGAFYQNQEIEIPYWQDGGFTFTGFVFAPDFPWATSPWDKEEEDWALFAHVAYDLTPDLELEAGLRHSDYETDQFTEWVFGFGDAPPAIPWPFTVPPASLGGDKQDIDETSLDGTIGLNWTLEDDHFFYALISRGHVTGGINIFPPFFDYDEMKVINYEAGWKASWLDDRVQTQFSAFYETFDDYQALFAMTGSGPANVATFRNAEDESEIWGLELSGRAVLGNLSVDFGVAYLDSELGTFKGVEDPFRVDDPETEVLENVVDLSGAESPFSPEITGNIGAQYAFALPNGATLTPRVDYSHIGDTQAGLWDSSLIELEDRDILHLQVVLEWEEWWARAWMTNVTDDEYVGGIQNNGSLRYAAPPRQFGLRVGKTF